MKAAIDELAEKLHRQIRDVRDKRVSRRKHPVEPALEDAVEAGVTES
jgi:ribosome-associated translation inhibitor RaiA